MFRRQLFVLLQFFYYNKANVTLASYSIFIFLKSTFMSRFVIIGTWLILRQYD